VKPFSIERVQADGLPADVAEIRIVGFLDTHTVVSFESMMDRLRGSGLVKFILDVSELNYISSAGIGAMMVHLQSLHAADAKPGGQMVLVNPTAKVQRILDLLGFSKIFVIVPDREAALRALEKNHG
jgi:anti-anti-sigma factor